MTAWIVYQTARDIGPSVAPDWRLWSVSLTDDVTYTASTWADDDKTEAHFRRRLVFEGFTVLDVEWEPICRHDLGAMTPGERDSHISMNECQHFMLVGSVRVAGRDARHAYEQACEVLGVKPRPVEVAS